MFSSEIAFVSYKCLHHRPMNHICYIISHKGSISFSLFIFGNSLSFFGSLMMLSANRITDPAGRSALVCLSYMNEDDQSRGVDHLTDNQCRKTNIKLFGQQMVSKQGTETLTTYTSSPSLPQTLYSLQKCFVCNILLALHWMPTHTQVLGLHL